LLERAEIEWETRSTSEWLLAYGRQIDNVRTALDWALSAKGDTVLGISLTVAAVPLWMILSLVVECRSRAHHALDSLPPDMRVSSEAMKLFAATGAALRADNGAIPQIRPVWVNALRAARKLRETDYQLRALCGLWSAQLTEGNFSRSLALARRFERVAQTAANPADALVGKRMVGFSLHYLGRHAEARQQIEGILVQYSAAAQSSHIIRFGYDQRARAHDTLAEALWLQGFPDQALRAARGSIAHAESRDHALSVCLSLSQSACPIALLVGDLGLAERHVTTLLDRSAKHALPLWHATGRCLKAVIDIRRGNTSAGLGALRVGLNRLTELRRAVRYLAFLAELADALGQVGDPEAARATIEEALDRCERNQEYWYRPELLRIRGAILHREGASPAEAEAQYLASMVQARQQQALSWELRAATSLARLCRS
jgi:predicted ATPase